ncbi:hypothetical protein NEOLEDRAFT_1020571, partial [Neolentinus lepideus HHB14362 ss-1]
RWMEYLSQFNYTIHYVKGKSNKVADCFSRYYESDNIDDLQPEDEYVVADRRLDPKGEDLPPIQLEELRTTTVGPGQISPPLPRRSQRLRDLTMQESRRKEAVEMAQAIPNPADPFILTAISKGYTEDEFFSKLNKDTAQKAFKFRNRFIWRKLQDSTFALCIPRTKYEKRRLNEIVLDQCHSTIGHLGAACTFSYIHRWYWW